MCGIFSLINLKSNSSTRPLVLGTELISHRGPDDEGYLLFNDNGGLHAFYGTNTDKESIDYHNLEKIPDHFPWKVGFGHKRLSIIDLTPAGHQPMIDPESGLTLIFNGEIYNYKELRSELELKGHHFKTLTDTEVLLKAWKEWGTEAPHRFNGMFSFIIFDANARKLFAIRDRFGVKPLYYSFGAEYIAFASEVKQLRILPEYQFVLNEQTTYDYLRYGSVDTNIQTFEVGLNQVGQGEYISVDLSDYAIKTNKWYDLKPKKWRGSFEQASEHFYDLLKDSVRLRMRSDVPVGSALSGGLDSSTIACLMREVLNDQGKFNHTIKTITSCFKEEKYDEWEFAKQVIESINAKSYRVFPTFEKLVKDIDMFLWHMDYPFGSTSQFSQWCVFEGAAKAGLKVMIDGQGADEQLAGYGGNDMALYTGLLNQFKLMELLTEVRAYKKYHHKWPINFVIGALQNHIPDFFLNFLPDEYRVQKQNPPNWLIHRSERKTVNNSDSLQKSLYRQVIKQPLPSLLRYEDRNSMAFSIESRVPFMDYRLIEFTLGLPEHFVYHRGERKHIMRSAFQDLVPVKVMKRRDKMGFVSPEELWLRNEGRGWFTDQIFEARKNLSDFIDNKSAVIMISQMSDNKVNFSFSPWRILTLNRFINMLNK